MGNIEEKEQDSVNLKLFTFLVLKNSKTFLKKQQLAKKTTPNYSIRSLASFSQKEFRYVLNLQHCSSLLLEQGPKSIHSWFHLSIHCFHPERVLWVCHPLSLLPGSLLWCTGFLRRPPETHHPWVKTEIACTRSTNASSHTQFHFDFKKKTFWSGKKYASPLEIINFLWKKEQNHCKTQPLRS